MSVIITILISIVLALTPYRVVLQGGLNITYILILGIFFRFVRCYRRYKHYKMIPSSPITIIPLIIVIEVVRIIIRPLSLILRILINLTIGHIVIYILQFPINFIYCLIEIFIYIIQIYIF